MTTEELPVDEITGVFTVAYNCKHSVRFNAVEKENIATSIYLTNKTFTDLGEPTKILLTVSKEE